MPIINPKQNEPKVTQKQQEYIDQLLIDVGWYDKRKLVIKSRFNKSFMDELTISEASSLIDELKEKKDSGAQLC